MFVDASAIVAIVMREPDGERLAGLLEAADRPTTSAIAVFEAALAIRRILRVSVAIANDRVERFLAAAGIRSVAIAPEDASIALDAFARYGEGQGHPAQLNMGDCFAYALAKQHRVPLLFKGDDFGKTDIPTVGAG